MGKRTTFWAVSRFGLMVAGATFASPVVAAREPQVAGYCWVSELTSVGTTHYNSATFQKDSTYFDRDRWIADFQKVLAGRGVNPNTYACRVWKGGAGAVEAANEEKARVPVRTQYMRVVDVDWVPEDTWGGSRARLVQAPSSPRRPAKASPPAAAPHIAGPPKYVEVTGPDGKPIRLSPEVAARNQAAADEYRRKMDAFARDKAEHARRLALHQQSQANAAAEQRAYQQQLAMNDAQVAAHAAAMARHADATKPPAKGAKGWMYCDARGAPADKRRFYSRVVEVDYAPGQVTIIDVMGKNRPAFKAYVAGTHSIFFATDSLVHCPYSTTSLADAEALMARDKRGDANNGISVTQTGWTPAS